jgi:phosphoribosylformylglycinamidine synthase
MRVKDRGVTVAEIPAKRLADDAPIYTREAKEPEYLKKTRAYDPKSAGSPGDLNAALLKLLDAPSIASKEWIYQQYDHMVRTNTAVLPGSDAAVIRIKGTPKALAVSTDCNSTYCYLDPYEGGKIAVAESARNVACSGAVPLSVTNCLNFGNPYNPEIYWQLKKSIEGMRDACNALGTPVSGGNVSLYNQNPKGAIDPTPTIAVVGLLNGVEPVTSHFKTAGSAIYLLGQTREELGGSEYLKTLFNVKAGIPPRLDLEEAARLNRVLADAAREKLMESAHDCAEGGLAVALAESCISCPGREIGAVVTYKPAGVSDAALYFGESQSRVVVSVRPEKTAAFEKIMEKHGQHFTKIGAVGGERLRFNGVLDAAVNVLSHTWRTAIGRRMEKP